MRSSQDVFSKEFRTWVSNPTSRELLTQPNTFARRPVVRCRLWKSVQQIRALESRYSSMTLRQLQDEVLRIKSSPIELAKTTIRNEVFAIVVEALKRVDSIRLYDVQLLASLILTTGSVAEMQTGEGKTYSVLPAAAYFSLFGEGVHVATTNPYLAGRDLEIVRPALQALGITCGLVEPGQNPSAAQQAYRCDVTYGPGFQFGFDYLADQISLRRQQESRLGESLLNVLSGKGKAHDSIQRRKAFCIIDEIDSVLLDEGTTPLLLAQSSGAGSDGPAFRVAKNVAGLLKEEADFTRHPRQVTLTEEGLTRAHSLLRRFTGVQLSRPWCEYIENALFAQFSLQRNVDYVIQEGQVQIVDQNTGRILPDQTWKNGLHQAVEVKEGCRVSQPTETMATISRQRLFSGYGLICGLTGTADGHQKEFKEFFDLAIVPVPTHQPSQKRECKPRFFDTHANKLRALVLDIVERNSKQQPVLIGTRTIAESLQISEMLVEANVGHQVLNGVQDENEANVVARAGQPGAVTVATNIAGRGTDIKVPAEALHLGGLHVVLVEPHDSTRVDRQLIGRCGRQGQVGSYQRYASAEDQLLDGTSSAGISFQSLGEKSGEVSRDYSHLIRKLQLRSEASGFAKRRQLKKQDFWQRKMLSNLFDDSTSQPG